MPNKPQNFKGIRSGNAVALTWIYVSGCTYNVLRTSDNGWAANDVNSGTVTDPDAPLPPPAVNSSYSCFAVQGGVSSPKATGGPYIEVQSDPDRGFKATRKTEDGKTGEVKLTWHAPGCTVKVSRDGGGWEVDGIQCTDVTGTQVTDPKAPPKSSYTCVFSLNGTTDVAHAGPA